MLRSALTLGLLLFSASTARAECSEGSVGVWPPPTDPLDPRGLLVIDAYGSERAWVRRIASFRPRLEGPAGAVPLQLVETNEGEFHTLQVVLRASRPLRSGGRYRFAMTGHPNPQVFGPAGPVRMVWRVARPDHTPPTWSQAPQARGTTVVQFGCGPAIQAQVDVDVTDTSPLLFRVNLSPPGRPARTYLIPAQHGRLAIGHGMCAGAFVLVPSVRYRVEIVAMDRAGNQSPAPGGPLVADGPSP